MEDFTFKTIVLNYNLDHPEAVAPVRQEDSDAYDLVLVELIKREDEVYYYDTGIILQPPKNIHTHIYARSSLHKKGYMLANSVGFIDSRYRGHLIVALYKFNQHQPDLQLPCRAVQLMPYETIPTVALPNSKVEQTTRGAGGFGSTG